MPPPPSGAERDVCRHLAYLGPPVDLTSLLLTSPHSLLRQTWAPTDMRGGGTINADGFGVGWWPAAGGALVRYRRAVPMWSDSAFALLAASTCSGAVLAAVRSATRPPVVETACAPFTDGQWLFSLNGRIAGWPESIAELAAGLPVTDLLTMDATTDSALLFALVIHRLRRGVPAPAAVADVVAAVELAAPGSRLNLLLTDGATVVANTLTHSLSVRAGSGAVTVASEPTDADPAWRPVPDRHLVTATSTGVDIVPLHAVPVPAAPSPTRPKP